MNQPQQPEAIYTVGLDPERPRHLLVEVQWQVQGAETRFRLPQWRPGRYEQSLFVRNLVGLTAQNENGEPLPVIKTEASEWLVHHPGSTTLRLSYRYFANQPDAGACWADPEWMYVNPVHCLMYREDSMGQPCRLHVRTEGMSTTAGPIIIATSLQGSAEQGLIASDYHELVDSPWMASAQLQRLDWVSEGVAFVLWMHGVPAPDEAMQAQICRQWEAMASVQIQTLGRFPQDEFHFMLVGLPYAFYHGVEHRRCTVLALGPASEIWKHLYRELLGVASHELFHAWNVKSFRPKGMESYRYEGWMYSELGYVYEGFTTYYGDLFLVRSGCLLPDEYLEEVNAYLLRHSENYGRYNHGLRESSIDTWVDGYSQSQSAPHRRVSIYAEGMLQALHLDLVIRSSTRDHASPASLDDLIRYLWNRFEQSPETPGYTQETLTLWLDENVIVPSTYKNWSDYFRIHYEQPNSIEESLRSILPLFGCRLTTSPNEDRVKHLLGLQMNWNQAEPKVEHCVPGSPAALAGLGPGDRWLSWEIQHESKEQGLSTSNPSRDTDYMRKELTFNDTIRIHWVTMVGQERYGIMRPHPAIRYYDQHKIEQDPHAGPNELRARKQWLGIE
ncbi:MAG: hypothetical protein RLZZ121_421 [Bacteroidota bacterium]|jgi:predicted metalloprotease with PDZ domain